ncbi:MAG: ribosome small subunit-dependent GTPase A [Metamycoplasmataceae bacterium]
MSLSGKIVKIIAGYYDIKDQNHIIHRTRGKGNLREKNITPLVGDIANFNKEGQLLSIQERKNFLLRPRVANVDTVCAIISLNNPHFNAFLLDKFLMIIEFQKIDVIIIFTKKDLGDNQPYYDYLSQGYSCFLIDNNQIDEQMLLLKKQLENKLNVFSGQSGVGKTTLLNNLFNLNEATTKISKSLKRGVHTTRVTEIFSFENIEIIDTPGFSSLEINLTKNQISKAFHDFNFYSQKCQFSDCLHFNEINCEIKKNVHNGKILPKRYENYLKLLAI